MNADEIRAKIEAAKQKWPERDVYVPHWDATVKVRGMSGEQRCDYQAYTSASDHNAERFRLKLLSLCVCDEAGELLYPNNHGAEYGEVPGVQLDRLTDAALELSFMTDSEIKELEKNSQTMAENGSG